MPPKKADAIPSIEAGDPAALPYTDAEQRIMITVFKNLTTKPDMHSVNWQGVKTDLDSASVESVKKRFQNLVKKYDLFADVAGEDGSAGGKTPTTPASTTKSRVRKTPGSTGGRKRKTPARGDDDDEEGEKVDAHADDADGESAVAATTPVKQRKRKPATPRSSKKVKKEEADAAAAAAEAEAEAGAHEGETEAPAKDAEETEVEVKDQDTKVAVEKDDGEA